VLGADTPAAGAGDDRKRVLRVMRVMREHKVIQRRR